MQKELDALVRAVAPLDRSAMTAAAKYMSQPSAIPQMKWRQPVSYIPSSRAAISFFSAAQRGSSSFAPHGSFAGRCPVKQQHFSRLCIMPPRFGMV